MSVGTPSEKAKKTRIVHPRFSYGRRGKNRTLTDGFGDHCSTIKLLSCKGLALCQPFVIYCFSVLV